MIPAEVAADRALRTRFLKEVAWRDGLVRTRGEQRLGTKILASEFGATAVAWLWPDRTYSPGFDPFDLSDARNTRDPDAWRRLLSTEFLNILVTAERESDRPRNAVLEHVTWTAGLGILELDGLLEGYRHLELMRLVLSALQVEFRDGWVLRDAELLGRRIDQAWLASQISSHMRFLTIENLTSLSKRLPKGVNPPVPAGDQVAYVAPPPGSEYRPLYEALASDNRTNPLYAVDHGSLILENGRFPLPEEALRIGQASDSWWAGRRTSQDKNPQASAWLAAGYQAGVPIQTDSNGLTGVGFMSLPGREAWLDDPSRLTQGIYRMPELIPIPPFSQGPRSPAAPAVGLPTLGDDARMPEVKKAVPDDIEVLVDFLVANGEASRKEIETHLRQELGDLTGKEVVNLLTRARRRKRAVNRGTDTQPRWVAVDSKGDYMLQTIEFLSPGPSRTVGRGSDIPDWFFDRAWEEVDEMGQLLDRALAKNPEHAWAAASYAALERVARALDGVRLTSNPEGLARLASLRDAAEEYARQVEPFRKRQAENLNQMAQELSAD